MCYCITTRPPSENGNFERETLFYISYCENWDLGFLKKLSCGPCASADLRRLHAPEWKTFAHLLVPGVDSSLTPRPRSF